jgi:hypothetical protein
MCLLGYQYQYQVFKPQSYLLTYLWTGPFLGSCQLCSHSGTSQHFKEPKVHHRVHKSPPLVPILSQIQPQSIPSHPISVRTTLILSTHLRLGLPSGLLAVPPISYPIRKLEKIYLLSSFLFRKQETTKFKERGFSGLSSD